MSQLTYNFNPAAARAGMVVNMEDAEIIESAVAEGLVPVAKLAQRGTRSMSVPSADSATAYAASPGQIKALAAGISDDPILDSEWLGIPIYDSSRPPYTSLDEYSDKDPVPYLRKGWLWVNSETAVTDMADVYVRVTASGGDVRGQFRAGAATNFVKFGRGRWRMTTTATGLAILEVW